MRRLHLDDVQGLPLRPRRGETGGEWDIVRSWPARVRRRLTGAGFMGVHGGYAPDQLVHRLAEIHGLDEHEHDEILNEWKRAALAAIQSNRQHARRRRESRLARRHGVTWYQYRATLYGQSVHQHAKAKGWR